MVGFGNAEDAFGFVGAISGSGFELAVLALLFSVVTAFFAIRLYRPIMALAGGLGVSFVAYSLIGPGAVLEGLIPPVAGVDSAVAISLGGAALGFIAGALLPRLVLFLGGIGAGGLLGEIFLPLIAPQSMIDPTLMLLLGLSAGFILGVLLSLFTRPVYILLTSFGSLSVAGTIAFTLLFPEADPLRGAAIGAVLGFIPTLFQLRAAKRERLI